MNKWNTIHHFLASCQDGVKNGEEEGIDCGGSCPHVCKRKSRNNSLYFLYMLKRNTTANLHGHFNSYIFLITGLTMACDLQNLNRKCPPSKDLIFHYEGENAMLEKCKDACFKDERCIALSGKFSESIGDQKWNWCIGCRIELTDCSPGAIAFKKKKLDVGNDKVFFCN